MQTENIYIPQIWFSFLPDRFWWLTQSSLHRLRASPSIHPPFTASSHPFSNPPKQSQNGSIRAFPYLSGHIGLGSCKKLAGHAWFHPCMHLGSIREANCHLGRLVMIMKIMLMTMKLIWRHSILSGYTPEIITDKSQRPKMAKNSPKWTKTTKNNQKWKI